MSLQGVLQRGLTVLRSSRFASTTLRNACQQGKQSVLTHRASLHTCVTLNQRGQSLRNQSSLDFETKPVIDSESPAARQLQTDLVQRVNDQISSDSQGRMFAVIHLNGQQFKVTESDLFIVKTNQYFADVGKRICLEKVLSVGSSDFTLIGRPLLDNVRVEATVVEKTLSHSRAWFMYRRRKNVRKMRLRQEFYTILRVNSIEVQEVDDEVD